MKFVIAPDKFKGSLTGLQFCDAVKTGLSRVYPNSIILSMPLADGGDGTIEVVKYYLKPEEVSLKVSDPFFRPVQASYLYAHDKHIAYIEMAEASGLRLLKESEINCMHTTTMGTGELIVDAMNRGAKEIILGIGGSATNDGGMGMARALGFRFLDKNDKELKPIGQNLSLIKTILTEQTHKLLNLVKFKVACDVTNPLYGPNGAARIYGSQKGASREEIEILDKGLRTYAARINSQLGIDVAQIPGAGAAGGLGAGAVVFLNATLCSGIGLIKEMANFRSVIENADWIITGEGRLDEQTLSGKTIQGVLQVAREENIPVAALCGSIEISQDTARKLGLAYWASVSAGMPNLEQAIKSSYKNVVKEAAIFGKWLMEQ